MLHTRQAGWCKSDRHGNFLADHRTFEGTIGHVDRNTLAQLDLAEILFVGAIGAFGPCTGIGVVEKHFRYAPLGDFFQIGNFNCLYHVPSRSNGAMVFTPMHLKRQAPTQERTTDKGIIHKQMVCL